MLPWPENQCFLAKDMDPLFGHDENRIRAEYLYLFQNVNVVESMLVAVNHMQVDVCYLRYGLTGFHKNIISFPQDHMDLAKYKAFLANVTRSDIVNVKFDEDCVRRAKVLEVHAEGFTVEMGDTGQQKFAKLTQIEQRIMLPWKPLDLRENLIVYRRRNARKEEFVTDLQVRRNLIKRLLRLLSLKGHWREHRGVETLPILLPLRLAG